MFARTTWMSTFGLFLLTAVLAGCSSSDGPTVPKDDGKTASEDAAPKKSIGRAKVTTDGKGADPGVKAE